MLLDSSSWIWYYNEPVQKLALVTGIGTVAYATVLLHCLFPNFWMPNQIALIIGGPIPIPHMSVIVILATFQDPFLCILRGCILEVPSH